MMAFDAVVNIVALKTIRIIHIMDTTIQMMNATPAKIFVEMMSGVVECVVCLLKRQGPGYDEAGEGW